MTIYNSVIGHFADDLSNLDAVIRDMFHDISETGKFNTHDSVVRDSYITTIKAHLSEGRYPIQLNTLGENSYCFSLSDVYNGEISCVEVLNGTTITVNVNRAIIIDGAIIYGSDGDYYGIQYDLEKDLIAIKLPKEINAVKKYISSISTRFNPWCSQ